MNTEAIQYTDRTTSRTIVSIANWVRSLCDRRQGQAGGIPKRVSFRQGNLLHNLPVEEKLRLGLYHFMD